MLEGQPEALATNRDTFTRNTRNQMEQVFDALRQLVTPPEPPASPERPIGFVTPVDKPNKPRHGLARCG